MKIFVNNIKINYTVTGVGPPMLLLHGYPQNLHMWRKLIPFLEKKYTIINSDLRGYGKSDKPRSDNGHNLYSKRLMAKDQFLLMKQLGFNSFICIGHDRGARVAHRLALDYASSLTKLILIDILPTNYIYENLNKNISESFFHWFFLSLPYPIPEKIIESKKEYYVKTMLGRFSKASNFLDTKSINNYVNAFSRKTIHSSCQDYRAGSSIDIKHHKNDKTKINCPTIILWGKNSLVGKNFKPLEVWKKYAQNVDGYAIKGGHYLPEENPAAVAKKILSFLK